MVCVTCIFIPIGLWIWFNIMMPLIGKLRALIWPKNNDNTNQGDVNRDTADVNTNDKLKCPFDFCKKSSDKSSEEKVREETSNVESKKTS
jgi:hypothetical protein